MTRKTWNESPGLEIHVPDPIIPSGLTYTPKLHLAWHVSRWISAMVSAILCRKEVIQPARRGSVTVTVVSCSSGEVM